MSYAIGKYENKSSAEWWSENMHIREWLLKNWRWKILYTLYIEKKVSKSEEHNQREEVMRGRSQEKRKCRVILEMSQKGPKKEPPIQSVEIKKWK